MLVAEFQTEATVTVPEGATCADAAEAMQRGGVGALVVVDGEGRGLALVTDRDLCLRALVHGDGGDTPLRRVWSEPLQHTRPDEDLSDALRRMGTRGVRRLPVLVDGRPQGMLTLDDLLGALSEGLHDLGTERRVRRRGAAWRGRFERTKDEFEALYDVARERLRSTTWYSRERLLEELDSLREHARRALGRESGDGGGPAPGAGPDRR